MTKFLTSNHNKSEFYEECHIECSNEFKFDNKTYEKNLETPSLLIYKASRYSMISIYTRIFSVLLCFILTFNVSLNELLVNTIFHMVIMTNMCQILETLSMINHIIFIALHNLIIVFL